MCSYHAVKQDLKIVFYIIWKICLACQNIQPTSYQGIGGAGLISVHEIPNALFKIVRDNIRFYLEWNIFDHGITVYSALNILFLTAFAVGIIVAIYKSGCWKKPRTLILLGLCVVSFPFGCFIWHFASAWVYYHTIMLQCICVIYILTGVLWDRWCCQDNHRADAVLLLLTAIVFNNSVAANICYNYFHQAFIKTQAIVAEMNTRIHLLDDGNVRYIAFSGALDNWGQDACFDQKQLRQLGPLKSIPKRMLSSYYMSLYSEFDLTYYRANDIEYPLQEMADESAAPRDYVFRFPQRSYIEQLELGQTDEVKNMPIWPAADSVKVIGDTIVIKLSEDIDIFG